jgi:hypothetical protein
VRVTQVREAAGTIVRSFRPARAASYVGAFFAGGLALSVTYATTGVGMPCPFRLLTGWNCPLCGGTRMGGALLHGDIAAAWSFNPVALVGLLVIGALGVLWTLEAAGGPAVRLPDRLGRRLRRVPATRWLLLGIGFAVVWTVLRNLL